MTQIRKTAKHNVVCARILLLLPLLTLAGCGGDTSAKENDDMRNAMQGKGVGPMPAETKSKMEAAMKAHGMGGNGAPTQTKQ